MNPVMLTAEPTDLADDHRPRVSIRLRDFIAVKSEARNEILTHYSFRVAPWGILAWFATGAGLNGTVYDIREIAWTNPWSYIGPLFDVALTILFAIVAVRATTFKATP